MELARRGYLVTGVDFSNGMLDVARKAAAGAEVEVEWICCDATQFSVTEPFDGCICTLESAFGYITPDQDPIQHDLTILQNVSAALKTGARFILGVSNGFKSFRDYDQQSVESGYFDPVHMLQEHELTWTTSEGVEERSTVRLRVYVPTEITMLLHQAQFEVEHVWGGTYGRRNIVLDGYIMTVVARKLDEAIR